MTEIWELIEKDVYLHIEGEPVGKLFKHTIVMESGVNFVYYVLMREVASWREKEVECNG